MANAIKYRVWDKSWKQMFGNDIMLKSGRELVTFAKRHSNIPAIQNAYGGLLIPTDDPNMVFMQYTGLNDVSGKEIYESDIVRLRNAAGFHCLGLVERTDGCFDVLFQYPLHENGITKRRDYVKVYVANHAIEVVGNKYENPDLKDAIHHD